MFKMALSQKWRLNAFEYKCDLAVTPILALTVVWGKPVVLLELFLGVLTWSLVEYVIHRFLFHRFFRKDHWAHHVDSSAYIGISGIYIGIACAIFVAPSRWLDLHSLYAGFLVGYTGYLAIHYFFHRPQYRLGALYAILARNHAMHHRTGIEKNFGVTSPLWDWVFSTYAHPNSTR